MDIDVDMDIDRDSSRDAVTAPRVITPSGVVRGTWVAETTSSGWRNADNNADNGTRSGAHSNAHSSAHKAGTTPIAVFRGIPYAEAPVGPLRFAAPVRRTPWSGELDATEYGPTPQRGDAGITLIPEHSIAGDDTLSVNVWTPDPSPTASLPVVVWIHGGGYISGSPVSPWYDGRAFARDGVVLVTLSYRLGFTGFGWIDGATPNRGVLDWILALTWVRDHISAFGGDPSRVTVAGQSAGGGAVLTLLGAPGAQGLFHGAYAVSSAIADPSLAGALTRTRRLARLAGVTPDVDGISSLSEERILDLQGRVTSPAAPHLLRDVHGMLRDGLMIGPVTDGEVVPFGIESAVAEGPSASVPLVLGTAADELAGLFRPQAILDRAPRHTLLRALGATPAAAKRWLADASSGVRDGAMAVLGRYATDAIFRSWVPRVARARLTEPAAGTTWSYSYQWHAEVPPQAGHCSDVPFLFDQLAAPGVDRVAGAAPPQQLADEVHGALVAFAKTGDPGWDPHMSDEGPTRVFDLPGDSVVSDSVVSDSAVDDSAVGGEATHDGATNDSAYGSAAGGRVIQTDAYRRARTLLD